MTGALLLPCQVSGTAAQCVWNSLPAHLHDEDIRRITVHEMHHSNMPTGSGFCSTNTNINSLLHEYLNPWYILAQTGTRRQRFSA